MERKTIILNKNILHLDISASSYKFLTILILYSDKEGRCYPSTRTLSEKYHLSRDTINRAKKELENKNVIRVYKRTKGSGKIDSNEYFINKEYLAESIKSEKKLELFDYDWLNDTGEFYD